jgi:dipeptidyl aminopeptidase/acylaminoacyl peptidase
MLLHEREQLTGPAAEDPELLIEEARTRGRRRRRRTAVVAVLIIGLGAAAFSVIRLGTTSSGPVAQSTPVGLFVNERALAGHGLLAFVSRGSLFVFDGENRKLTRVTAPGVPAGDPRFSPDGWLIYRSGTTQVGLARGDGSSSHTIGAGAASWLPNGELLFGNGVYRIGSNGRPIRVADVVRQPVAWSSDGDRYAFVRRSITHDKNGAFHGVERLQVASSISGTRITWLAHPFSFTPRSGFVGYAVNGVVVLPDQQGLLYWVDPLQSASLAADGTSVYELRSPGSRPVTLAVTVGDNISIGSAGKLALGAGGNRYAWTGKTVETCSPSTGQCKPLPTQPGVLSIDPAWAPDGHTLAFVEAAPESTSLAFTQPILARWYATHSLWLLHAGSTRPTKVAGTQGASSPTWSADGKSLLYVSGDALWLIPQQGASPEKVVAPLFPKHNWPSYYGQINWANQFAWTSPAG